MQFRAKMRCSIPSTPPPLTKPSAKVKAHCGCDDENTLLASLTFTVAHSAGQRVLVIGGLQGPRRGVTRDVIKQATRACHGLFPKRVLMEVIFQLVAQSNIRAIYAVSDEGHVFRALRYRLSKGRHFHASYDEFWETRTVNARPSAGSCHLRWRVNPGRDCQ